MAEPFRNSQIISSRDRITAANYSGTPRSSAIADPNFHIGINDVSNGVFLPANQATQVIAGETIHSTLHTKEYYDAVNQALAGATTRQQVIGILQNIRQALQSGDYP